MGVSKAIPRRWVTYVAGGLGILILLLHLWSLQRYPSPSADEAWLTSRAWAFQQTGHPFGPLDAGISDQLFSHYWLTNQWLITAIQSLVLRLTVRPGLLALRVLSLAWGGVLLAASGWSATRLFGKSVGYLSVLMLALSPAFFYSAHQVRYDVMASALAYASVACYFASCPTSRPGPDTATASRPSTRWRFCVSMLGGFLLALAIETHLNCLVFVPAIGLLVLIEDGSRFWRQPDFWGFVCGGLIGAGCYLIVHVLPSPSDFLYQFRLDIGATHQPPISSSLAKALQGFGATGALLLVAGSSLVVFVILSVPVLVRLRSKPAVQVLVLNATLIVAAALTIPNKAGHYAILLAPGLLWPAAFFLDHYRRSALGAHPWDYLSRGLVGGVLASFVLISALPLANDGTRDYQMAQSQINRQIRPGDSVIGPQVYWFGLYDHTYFSWELLFLYKRVRPDSDLEEAFAAYRPDVFIIDRSLDILISDSIDPDSRWYQYHLPRAELFDYLTEHAHLEASLPAAGYGPIQIYRISWDSAYPQQSPPPQPWQYPG
jgi:4-amino-4-deoxy-L-arabinose transferase-like glycosyltransferase